MKPLSRILLSSLLLLTTWQIAPSQNLAKPSNKPLNQPGEDANFQHYLSSGRISVVTFYADWCPSCRSWAPILDDVNAYFPDMQVLFMDIGEWDTPVTEKYDIQSVPHFKIYDGSGGLIAEGAPAKEWLRQAISQRLAGIVRGTYRVTGQPASIKINNVARSVTTRPRAGAPTPRARASEAAPAWREKIETTGPLPSVDEVIDRYLAAMGGAGAAEKFSTRSVKGKVNISTMGRGSFASYAKAPNKVVTTIEIPELGVIKQGFNGAAGWSQHPRTGVRSATDSELATLKRDAIFHSFTTLKTRYPKMKVLGVTKIGFREAYLIEARPAVGDPERLFFSKDNGLLIRWDALLNAGGVKIPAEVYLDDWTNVDGIKLPFTITQLLPRVSIVFSFNEVRHDIELSETVFNRPSR